MKKKLLFVLVLALGFSTVQGQTMKEKIAAKQKAIADKMKAKNAPPSDSTFESQAIVTKAWVDGEYAGRRVNGGMLEPYGKVKVTFEKDADGRVKSITVRETKYPEKLVDGTDYVKEYGLGRMDRLYLTATTVVQYRMANGTTVVVEGVIGEKVKVNKITKEIIAYRKNAESKISADQDAAAEVRAAEAKKKAAERLAEYGLADKDVKSIKIVNLNVPDGFGHFSSFTFDIEATLKNGKKITAGSKGFGYMDDYVVSYGDSKYNGYKLESGFDADDKVIVTVKLKKDPSIKTEEDVVIPYGNLDMGWAWNGESWSLSHGKSAHSFKIEIKQVKHAVTGAILLQIRVTDLTTGKVVDEIKMDREKSFKMFCRGGNGGSDDGQGKNGGDGGDVTLVKDPNVEFHSFIYKNNGGKAGKGSSYSGSAGRDGEFKEEVRAVNF